MLSSGPMSLSVGSSRGSVASSGNETPMHLVALKTSSTRLPQMSSPYARVGEGVREKSGDGGVAHSGKCERDGGDEHMPGLGP